MFFARCVPGNQKRIICFFLALLCTAAESWALEPVSALDDGFAIPSGAGMSGASYHYPGAESFQRRHFAIVAWYRPFGIDDLAVTTVHTGTTMGRFGLSLSYSGSGFDLYGDEQEKIGVSCKIMRTVSIGVRATRNAMRIKGFGDAAALGADIGVVVQPVESVYIAVSHEDIFGAELGDSHEPLDGRTRLSASLSLPGEATLLTSISKVRLYTTSFSGGVTLKLFQSLTLGVIGGNEPDRMEFLVCVPVRNLQCSYRGLYHRDLGMSHGFSLSWE